MGLEIHKMLAASTGHITKDTADMLRFQTDDVPTVYDKEDYGWWIVVPDDDRDIPHTCPAELRALLVFAREQGCTWLMLDCDAHIIDGLPTFERTP